MNAWSRVSMSCQRREKKFNDIMIIIIMHVNNDNNNLFFSIECRIQLTTNMLLQAFEPTAHMLTYGALTVDRKPVENPPV